MKVGEAVVGLGVGAEVVGVDVKVGSSVGEVDGIAVGEIVVGFRVGEAVGIACRKFCVTCAAVKAVKLILTLSIDP